MRRALIILVAAGVVTGCGNDVTQPANIREIGPPGGFRDVRFPEHGISLRSPAGWRTVPGEDPQVATIATGDAQIAIWRYPREEPLPSTRAELQIARDELIRAVKSRTGGFEVSATRIVVKEGLRGVELLGTATNQGLEREVRSLHAYGEGAEVVVDAFAPAASFARVDEQTFAPVARSLKLRAPRP
ncbi:MAG: hypothetical protein H0T43_12145 [Solirubrobacterales bacterium]|nr:hypothetical protein [Solirubrobacterales bacterium]